MEVQYGPEPGRAVDRGVPDPVVESAGGNPAGSRISESHAAKRARPVLTGQGTRSFASDTSIGIHDAN